MADRQETGGRTGVWMRVLLVVSLALNLLVAGLVAGWLLRHGAPHRHHAFRADMAGGPLTRALNEEDRHEISRRMRTLWREGTADRREMRAGLDAMVADLRAVPFDPARIAAHMRQQREAVGARFEAGQEMLLDHFARMSDAERAAYADRLEAQITGMRDRRASGRTE